MSVTVVFSNHVSRPLSLQKAKPLSVLYDDVKKYKLVIVPDAPLASDLNRHIDRPHLGDFATTPR
jgi:hypothetical protein